MAYSKKAKAIKAKWMEKVLKKPSFKKKAVTRVKGPIQPRKELKYVDVANANYDIQSGAGVLTLLNGIATGDDNTTRDGRQATMKSLHVVGKVTANQGSAIPAVWRMLLIWDNAPNGAAPVVTDILTADTSASFPLVNNANRFTILRDCRYPVAAISTTATSSYAGAPTTLDIDEYVRLDEVTQFSGTGATIASIQNGAIWMLMVSDQPTFVIRGNVATRVRFTDD